MQNARLAECERLLLAVDLGLWCGDSSAALQAVVSCYGLLAPLIYHQIVWEPMVQVRLTPRYATRPQPNFCFALSLTHLSDVDRFARGSGCELAWLLPDQARS